MKATSITGSASIVGIILGVVRVKILSLLIGPTGVGLLGLCNSLVEMGTTITGLGLRTSGVREIAGDRADLDRTSLVVSTMLQISMVLAIFGGLAMFAFAGPISVFTFGDEDHADLVAILGIPVFAGVMTRHFTATVQGMQRISDLAKLMVIGAASGTAIGLPIIWLLGIDGVGPMLVALSATSLAASWWYSKKNNLPKVVAAFAEYVSVGRRLLSHGVILMITGLATVGAAYIVRVLVQNALGIEAVGWFAAAYTLSSLYVGFVLQAMSADYFPRLSAMTESHPDMVRYVNRQLEVSILIAVTGIIATIAYSDLVIYVFYSDEFEPAAGLLQWQVLGVFGRVVSWPLSFVLLAKARKGVFLFAEISTNSLYIMLAYAGLEMFGLAGVGVAFFLMYVYYTLLMRVLVGRLVGFRFSKANIRMLLVAVAVAAGVFLATAFAGGMVVTIISSIVVCVVGGYCLRSLNEKLDGLIVERFMRFLPILKK